MSIELLVEEFKLVIWKLWARKPKFVIIENIFVKFGRKEKIIDLFIRKSYFS